MTFSPLKPAYIADELCGLAAGLTCLAYLFFKISISHLEVVVEGKWVKEWAVGYLGGRGLRGKGSVRQGLWGY